MKIVFRKADDSDFDVLFQFYSRPHHTPDFTKKLVELYLNHYFVKLAEVGNEIVGILV